ncbi:MAG TPA: TonB family protein [Longimicrobiales bacterium]|nr:TonB family protein [Longimicrobiales bacterium]
MSAQPPTGALEEGYETAHDRFKGSFGNWFWGSMIAATVLHFGLFALFPELTAEDYSYEGKAFEAINLPPELDIPESPEPLARPAAPVVTDMPVKDPLFPETTWEANPPDRLPKPPGEEKDDLAEGPVFRPYTVAPEVTNRAEVQRALEREYPSVLRQAGIGGTVNVWFFIDEKGRVQDTRLVATSGHPQLDAAALAVADIMEFTPAMNRDQRVPVWVNVPIVFEVH